MFALSYQTQQSLLGTSAINSDFQKSPNPRSFQYSLQHQRCRSSNVIYLLHCRKCNIQYVGKTENPFNIRLNNHHHGANHPTEETIPAAKHFSINHEFNRDAKFTIIEQIKDNSKSQEEKRAILLRKENFWITKLHTLTPLRLNQELN